MSDDIKFSMTFRGITKLITVNVYPDFVELQEHLTCQDSISLVIPKVIFERIIIAYQGDSIDD